MNREIEFRGKAKNDGLWEYGSLWIKKGKYYICGTGSGWEVIPETVGQYTGKKDKNDKKIYDGTIIKFKEWSKGEFCWIGEVVYDYGSMYVVRGNPNKECDSKFEIQLSRLDSERIEVIGNIHDDKELLEVKKMDKYQEALDSFKAHMETYHSFNAIKEQEENINILQELVDKETPKIIIKKGSKSNSTFRCPNSDEHILNSCFIAFSDYNYCPYCGQKLDWSEEEYQEMYEENIAFWTEWEEDDIYYMGRRMNYKDLFLKIKSKFYSFKQKKRNIDLKNMYIGLSNDDFQKLIRAGSELDFYCADGKLYFMGVFISPNYELKPGEIVIGIKEKL